MDCTGCGSCCTDHDIVLTSLEQMTIPKGERSRNGRSLARVDGRCIRLDPITKRCTKYEERPQTCRNFRPGCGACTLMRAYAEVHLGGIGDHPLPAGIKPGSYRTFLQDLQVEIIHSIDRIDSRIIVRVSHPAPDPVIRRALEHANASLPSEAK